MVVVFWGGREGFQSLLNTNVHAELSHMAAFFTMAVGELLMLLQLHVAFDFVFFGFSFHLTV